MNFKKGDKVVVIAGKDKTKEGTIIEVLRDKDSCCWRNQYGKKTY